MTIVFRNAAPSDAKALAELGRRSFVETFGHLYSPEDLTAFLDNHSVEGWAQELAPVSVKAVVIGQPSMLRGDLAVLGGHAYFDPYAIGRVAFGLSTPAAVLVGTDGKLAGGPALGEHDIIDFVALVREHIRAATVEVSDAP